uniref:SFRICE_024196 n=1 Tax=Spodoptera frugiperda TaxID=7108 RepID=A0A2H1WW73_SPOFR
MQRERDLLMEYFIKITRSAPFDVQSTICPTRAGNKLAYYQSSSSIFDAKEIGLEVIEQCYPLNLTTIRGRGFDPFDPGLLSIKLDVELSLNGFESAADSSNMSHIQREAFLSDINRELRKHLISFYGEYDLLMKATFVVRGELTVSKI